MILADTSVWIDHLRAGNADFEQSLQHGLILRHPWVVGELLLGIRGDHAALFAALNDMREAEVASNAEMLHLIEAGLVSARGVGFVDTQLIASALLEQATLWTLDKRMAAVANDCGVSVHGQTRPFSS